MWFRQYLQLRLQYLCTFFSWNTLFKAVNFVIVIAVSCQIKSTRQKWLADYLGAAHWRECRAQKGADVVSFACDYAFVFTTLCLPCEKCEAVCLVSIGHEQTFVSVRFIHNTSKDSFVKLLPSGTLYEIYHGMGRCYHGTHGTMSN